VSILLGDYSDSCWSSEDLYVNIGIERITYKNVVVAERAITERSLLHCQHTQTNNNNNTIAITSVQKWHVLPDRSRRLNCRFVSLPVLTQLRFMTDNDASRKRTNAELAEDWKLRDGLFDGQIARYQRAADLTSTSWTRCSLVLQSSIRKEVWQTARTHQMSIGTLKQNIQI